MRKDSFTNPKVIIFLTPHIYVSRPYHRIFNEKSIWTCKIRTGFLQGRGETPTQAYKSWVKLYRAYHFYNCEKLEENYAARRKTNLPDSL